MKKKIAIMISIILMAGTFTDCTAEEKMYNSSLSPTVSTSVGVSASAESSEMATTETTTNTEKPQFQKKQSLRDRMPKPKKKPTVSKIRRLFRQRLRFRKHNPRFGISARIQRTVISKNQNRLLKKKLKILLKSLLKSQRKSLCRSLRKSQRRNQRTILRNRLPKQKRLMFIMR